MRKGNRVTVVQKPRPHPQVRGLRSTTHEEVNAWYDSPLSKGMNCAGETKLPPSVHCVELVEGRQYLVLRARCRPVLGYSHSPGMALLECPITGEQFYVNRNDLRIEA